jgi:NADPH-dependent curcumin reductase CurA
METTNRQIRLAARPSGLPKPSDWEHTTEPVRDPGDGELLIQTHYLSLDPAMRGWMNEGRSYIPPVEIGEVMRAGAVGKVLASNHDGFAEGDHVTGVFGVQEYATVEAGAALKIDPDLAPLPAYLGALGMPGMTAYFGVLDVGEMKEGDTVVVSGAAGAVGSVAGQVARIKGAGRVIGIAGGEEKCGWIVDDLGFDAAIDYKSEDVGRKLREHAPDGVNVYFDNVGGEILDTVLVGLARHARVVICGAISQYNEGRMRGPSNYMMLLVTRSKMQGFVVFDYASRYGESAKQLGEWLGSGELKAREDIVEGGVDAFPDTLLRLFRGDNVGKQVLKVS